MVVDGRWGDGSGRRSQKQRQQQQPERKREDGRADCWIREAARRVTAEVTAAAGASTAKAEINDVESSNGSVH